MQSKTFSLLELTSEVKETLSRSFPQTLWVKGEINEIRQSVSGHCYIELVEKDEATDNIVAKARATIWAYIFRMLKPYFEMSTGQQLESGISVMLAVNIEFHNVYGFSLDVKDIDPAYTLGDIEKKRLETIKKLEEDGVFDMNRKLQIPDLPKHIAVISSSTAAGYQDFLHQLENNEKKFVFNVKLFPALMQGNNAADSVVEALESVYERQHEFDVVAIIRGGGATSDLNAYNSYHLASHIAQFPVPVLTGIGHERDTTVADMVACRSFKTPTAVSAFLVDIFAGVDNYIFEISEKLAGRVTSMVSHHKNQIDGINQRIAPVLRFARERAFRESANLQERIDDAAKAYIKNKKQRFGFAVSQFSYLSMSSYIKPERVRLENLGDSLYKRVIYYRKRLHERLLVVENNISLSDPANLLKKGYAMVIQDQRVVKSVKALKMNDNMETIMKDGRILSRVKEIFPDNNK